MSLPSDDLTPLPSTRHGQIEVDTFCTGCFYNLHGQVVTIDERLGFPICRCPECGRFHPAGVGVTASSVWVRRWATSGLFVWVMIVLTGTIGILFAMGGMSAASVEAFTDGTYVTPQGLPLNQNFNNGNVTYTTNGSKSIVANPKYAYVLRPWHGGDENRPGVDAMLVFSAISLALGLFAGVLLVTLLWHWPRYRYFMCGLLPMIPCLFLAVIYSNNDSYQYIRAASIEHFAAQTAIQIVGLLTGVAVGRAVSRTIIRAVIPPKPRQALAFLWKVDGKKLPVDQPPI